MGRRWARVGLVLAVVMGLSFSVAPVSAQAETNSGMSIDQVRQQLDDLEQQQQDLAAQKFASQEKLQAAQSQLQSTQAQIAAQKQTLGVLQAQISQIALQQFQDRGLNTTALIMTSSSTSDLLNYISAVQQVTDTTNTLFTTMQLQQGALADLQRSEQMAIDTISAEQANLDSLDQAATAKVTQTSNLLNSMTAAAKATSGGAATGINAVGNGVADPNDVVPNPSPSLVSPLTSYTITDNYGMRVHPIWGTYSFHDGLDMAASCGTTILAPANGYVMDYYWAGGYGNRFVVDHGIINGQHVVTSFNHLSSGVAKTGDEVTQGQAIALVGSTGDSTGCHLHYMIWIDGQMVDPKPFV